MGLRNITVVGPRWNSALKMERKTANRTYSRRIPNWYRIDNRIGDRDYFAWGYNGSGPAATAYSILRELFGRSVAENRYTDFVELFVSRVPENEALRISGGDICKLLKIRTGRK